LHNIRRIKYNHTANQENAFELLTLGRSDAFIGNRLTAEFLLEKYGLKDEYIFADSYVLPLEYSMAVQKQNYELLFILNRALKHLKVEGSYSDIYDQWFPIEDSVLRQRLEKTIQVFVVILAVGLLFLFLEIRWNRQLQKEVERKTRDLKDVNRTLEYQIQQTKNSDQFKEQILESSPRGIVTCNQQGVITSINPKALKIAGLEDSPVEMSFNDVPMIGQLFKGKLDTVLREGTQYISEERTSIRADGKSSYVRFNVYPLFDFEKKIIGIILSFEDVTEERKVREQLFEQEKSRALSQLVAGVAHEIRNPLTSIKTFVELIPRKLNSLKFQKEILTHVPKEIERLNHLIEGLIDYAKPTSIHKETIEINQLVQSCIILFHRSVQNKGFNVQAHIEEDIFLEVDPNQLKQVIINLILNGLEAMEEKSLPMTANEGPLTPPLILTIRGWAEEQSVYIAVEDQGIGMTKEEIRRSVDPFYTSKTKGTGLGLALSKQFIQENGGTLHIESRKYEGTKITIRFREKELNHGKIINY
jgi:polar amino acid transport system substrate-binding protein